MLGIIFAFIVGFFVFVAKIRFVKRIIAAKVDINVFNLTLALCFVASGKNYSLTAIWFGNGWIAFLVRSWDNDTPSLHIVLNVFRSCYLNQLVCKF